ncbi:HAL/PAL/TAL family ammonia-lyase [Lichenicola sp.]|uniref:HAL/PAL/TAL family ammonia-lyase n=1 Tax=Lichenicola sp. TaxID=2804529 RepID=UPI003B00D719
MLPPAAPILELGGERPVTPHQVVAAARGDHAIRLHPDALARIAAAHTALLRAVATGAPIYGVTTGLGAVADTSLGPDDADVQRRIVLTRAVGVGPVAGDVQVRAMMIARLAGFAVGTSGASPSTVRGYQAVLNAGIRPVVPLLGSLGEGDLAPLAHIGSVLLGEGTARLAGQLLPGGEALAQAGLSVPRLQGRDGLAMVSSSAACSGLGALLIADIERVFSALAAAAALSFEAQRANLSPLRPEVAALHPVPGQVAIAAEMLRLLQGGSFDQSGGARRLHDPLSFRCAPAVLGSALAAIQAADRAVATELAWSDDNPAVLATSGEIVGTASFDTTHLALAFEALGLALSRVAVLTGARIMQLMSAETTGLPRFLTPRHGGRSGLAPLQKTVAALVAAIARDAQPVPACVLAVADGIEDYAGMAMAVVCKTASIVEALGLLAACELVTAAQAIDLRMAGEYVRLGIGTAVHHAAVRALVAGIDEDRSVAGDLETLATAIRDGLFQDVLDRLFPAAAP